MKTLLLLIFTTLTLATEAQLLCIKCYDQNARILTDTNNLIVNGGLENGCFLYGWFCPNSASYNCDIANWICTGGGNQTYAKIVGNTFSTIIEGTKAAYFGNYHCTACSTSASDTSCISNIGCEVTGITVGHPVNQFSGYGGDTGVSLSQAVNGLTIGAIYLLEFWAGGESDVTQVLKDGLFAVDIGFGNIFLRDPPSPRDTGIGRRFVIAFTAISSSHTIKFTNWGHIGTQISPTCTELVLDDVRLLRAGEGGNFCTTGLDNLTKDSLATVYPNPCGDKLNITNSNNSKSEIILYDITGRKVLQQQFVNSSTLSTGQLNSGLYYYEVTSNVTSKRGTIIKQ